MFNIHLRSRWAWAAVGLLFFGFILALSSVDQARWRLHVVRLKATTGAYRDFGWLDILRMRQPGDPLSADIVGGRGLFESHCAICHGANGSGGQAGPALRQRQMTHGDSDWSIFRTISSGIPGTAMSGTTLSEREKWRLVAYVKSLMLDSKPTADSTLNSAIPKLESVSYEEILTADHFPDRWLTYSGSYDGHRFSPISQITPANVGGLRLLWMRQYNTSEPSIETTPLVVSGYMFLTVPPNRVEALDAKTGTLMWAYDRKLPEHLSLCCGYVNRGLAVLGRTLFFGAPDAHLVALDISTGRVTWDVEIADYKAGYSITAAPLALKNLIITGVAGGEFGIRGFVDARDRATGKEVWRFNTIPQPGQAGADTWEGNAWKTGGGPTWLTGSFDPDTNLIYWPIGNPSPNFEGETRTGDNLYTNSVVALDADQGTLRWYFQFTPHDVFDWDATEILVLLDEYVAGKRQRLLAQANRNAFFYLMDRETGFFRLAQQFAKQTWADGIDNHGRPVVNPAAHPTAQGTAVYPGVGGATNWQSPSYSRLTKYMYVSALDWGGMFYEGHAEYRPGESFLGGTTQFFGERPQGAVRALKALTGEIQWEYRNPAFSVGGLMSTAGGVVFGSQEKNFFALDANTGHELWRVSTGGRVVAAPITFLCDGRQMVTIAAGHDILTFGH